MARVEFYEKPGCGTNTRQKAMLAAAGHEVVVHNLLTEPWTEARLRGFFGDAPLLAWFNPAAPRIKSGEIDPERLGEAGLIEAMLTDPLLIRRPLIMAEGQQCAGFDREPVLSLLGPREDLDKAQGCSRPEAKTPCPAPKAEPDPRADIAFIYHERTKHRFSGYAKGPETLDWDGQPNPFREFAGAPRVALDLAPADLATPFHADDATKAAPLSVMSVGTLLHLAMGLSAWKEFGPDRWALRCNPSSGNLHPTEAYVLASGVEGLGDGLYHYVSRDHALEQRHGHVAGAGAEARLWIGLSSIHWREAWKYGERAFRYCQLDLGHALGSVQTAAAALGWQARVVESLDSVAIAHLLGLDRAGDFGRAEREDADVLIELTPLAETAAPRLPLIDVAKGQDWAGAANVLDRHPMYRWPIIPEVSEATLGGEVESDWSRPAYPPRSEKSDKKAIDIILGRRSAQHFAASHHMKATAFYGLLDALLVRSQNLWDVWTFKPRLHAVLFVHRVEGLDPGLYILPRHPDAEAELRLALSDDFNWTKMADAPAHLPLYRLKAGDCRGMARQLFCNQAIAADSCFGVSLLAEFEDLVRANSWRYRQLHWEAGLIGQSLYLESEAIGLRGTGIGCYFDDEVHEKLGLQGKKLQALYHFTVGLPLVDSRMMTLPAYPDRQAVQEQANQQEQLK